ncbi:hypothetical protein LX36DRAFT_93850 [Colletotrichum falcatum]|nr:hypothetical protein LX36DRAFT_93850 [Colletotrichum falcatum]
MSIQNVKPSKCLATCAGKWTVQCLVGMHYELHIAAEFHRAFRTRQVRMMTSDRLGHQPPPPPICVGKKKTATLFEGWSIVRLQEATSGWEMEAAEDQADRRRLMVILCFALVISLSSPPSLLAPRLLYRDLV